ncbi:ABC transporter permease [Paenibacillus humicola]|uniref:ABC transporter permease n=1 Tax=Paenibacillus humicola TaxID=3110540 RepID=UPI00237B6570|nr:ABC transporter permease [Paenibacillus humicola]
MNNLIWLIRKTLLNTFRIRKNVFAYIGMPLMGVVLSFILYGHNQQSMLRLGIASSDGSDAITRDAAAFVTGLQPVKVTALNEAELRKDIAAGSLDAGLVFDKGFGESVRAGRPAGIQIMSVKGAQVTAYIKSMLNEYIANVAAIGSAAGTDDAAFKKLYDGYRDGGFKVAAERLADTSSEKNTSYQSIGFLITFMLFSAFNLTDLILKEKENRTYFRLLSSPVSAKMYVLANVIVSLAVMLIQIAITLFVMKYVFHLASGIPLVKTGTMLLMFGLTAVGLSLMIVALSKSSTSASALMNLIVTPTCLLSGCFFPMSIMPASVQKIAEFLPQHWLLDSFVKLQEGSGLGGLSLNLAILAAFAAAFALIAVYKFSRSNDTRVFT